MAITAVSASVGSRTPNTLSTTSTVDAWPAISAQRRRTSHDTLTRLRSGIALTPRERAIAATVHRKCEGARAGPLAYAERWTSSVAGHGLGLGRLELLQALL